MRGRRLQQAAVKKALLAGTAILLLVAAASLLHYRRGRGTSAGNELTRRIACRDNLNQIYDALLIYAGKNGGLCPDRGLWQLWENGHFSTPAPLTCPSANSSLPRKPEDIAGSCDYLFFPIPNWQRRPLPAIVCDRYGNHPGGVVHGLFADGLVLRVKIRGVRSSEPTPEAIRDYLDVVRRHIAVVSGRLRAMGVAAQKCAVDGKTFTLEDLVAQGYLHDPEALLLPLVPSLTRPLLGHGNAQSPSPGYFLNPKALQQPGGGTEPLVFQRARPQDVYLCCLYSDMKVRALCPISVPRYATVDDGVAYYQSSILGTGQIAVLQPVEIGRLDPQPAKPPSSCPQSTGKTGNVRTEPIE